jgi:hypothetical protein
MYSFGRAYALVETARKARIRAVHAEHGRAMQAANSEHSAAMSKRGGRPGAAIDHDKLVAAIASAEQARAEGLAECERQRAQERRVIDVFANLAPPPRKNSVGEDNTESSNREYRNASKAAVEEFCEAWRETHRISITRRLQEVLGRAPTTEEVTAEVNGLWCPASAIDVVTPQSVATGEEIVGETPPPGRWE